MMFVFELGCEELPSSSLPSLNSQFEQLFAQKLNDALLGYESLSVIAAPRRLGVVIEGVKEASEDKPFERKGPAFQAAFQGDEPTKALLGFCRGLNISPEHTSVVDTDKGQWVVYRGIEAGKPASEVLGDVCQSVIADLALSKPMRWGSGRDEFPRPVHWVLAMLDNAIVPVTLFGLESGNETFGHRFMAPESIQLKSATEYRQRLKSAYVIADFEARKAATWATIQSTAESNGVTVEADDKLLTEINCLVEWPVGLCGEFEKRFLDVPDIALIAAMKGHQKYFHTRTESGDLSYKFITVSNIESRDAFQVISGNQRVIRARLSDAKFFFETDKKVSLESRRQQLDSITFHPKLGSLGEKTSRVGKLACEMARVVDADTTVIQRAVELSRCDLVSEMVLEFDELQGKIGTIYSALDGEAPEVSQAIQGLYQPAGASDSVPEDVYGTLLALSDRLDTLAGLFAINQPPTGSKDPFALRRAAIGVLRLNEHPLLKLDLTEWVQRAFDGQPVESAEGALDQLIQFIKDRERVRLTDSGYRHDIVVSVQASNGLSTAQTEARVKALIQFAEGSDFSALVATNKRVANLLKDCEGDSGSVDPSLFSDPSEEDLFSITTTVSDQVREAVSRETFSEAISELLSMKPATDSFFENVMVNADDARVRSNRLELCRMVRDAYRLVADFSLIQQ
ncbi:MAG: glycine--tRNA ligase subunit beta [Gammaproteobacteria bacterium]|nr:glycine--tRNA ligase subunit beta [Gammaproteobacteria bacterium]